MKKEIYVPKFSLLVCPDLFLVKVFLRLVNAAATQFYMSHKSLNII